jgi:CRP-like cAMP-binding protein
MNVTPAEILEKVAAYPVRAFAPGALVLPAGSSTDRLLFLKDGLVEILIEETPVAQVGQPGAIFGEMAFLLGRPHTADVVAVQPARLFVVDDPAAFLEAEPRAGLYLASVLAERLNAVNHLLAEARQRSTEADVGLPSEALRRVTQALQIGAPGL